MFFTIKSLKAGVNRISFGKVLHNTESNIKNSWIVFRAIHCIVHMKKETIRLMIPKVHITP